VFHGYVFDPETGRRIAGAVVSLEWNVRPTLASRLERKQTQLPTLAMVSQERTDANGEFSFESERREVALPEGTEPEPGDYPCIHVYAPDYENRQVREPKDRYALDAQGGKWPAGEVPVRLYRAPASPDFESQQIGDWYASLDYIVRGEVWPGGQAEALASTRPFLALIGESCDRYRRRSGKALQVCEVNEHRYEKAPVSAPPTPLISELPPKTATDPTRPPALGK
jgi:hypothetical protein